MTEEDSDYFDLENQKPIRNGAITVYILPVRPGSEGKISTALILLHGINHRVRNRNTDARYYCLGGRVDFHIWKEGRRCRHKLVPGKYVDIPAGTVYQDMGKCSLLLSLNKPAFDPNGVERVISLGKVPDFQSGKVHRETNNYLVATDWKPGMENQPGGERFYIIPRNKEAETMLARASFLHRVSTLTSQLSSNLNTDGLQALRADFIRVNILPLFYGLTEVPPEGEDSIPSPDRLEKCLRDHPDRYTFFD